MQSIHLFTYGTLMIPRVFQKVTGICPPSKPGVLFDYDCYRLKNQSYPGIVFKPNTSTRGIVYFDLTPENIKKLDIFEGDLYDRTCVSVALAASKIVEAFTYILKSGAEGFLSNHRWSKTEFETRYLNEFLEHDPGFNETSREKNLQSEHPHYER
jgi:gamma-glutamylcyclotransferase (GGCT)/AIG2-like uncharacterized protein YtfP